MHAVPDTHTHTYTHLQPPTPNGLPCPEDARKLLFYLPVSSPVMEDELKEALTDYGGVEKVAMNIADGWKLAFVALNTPEGAEKCKDAFDHGTLVVPDGGKFHVSWAAGPATKPSVVEEKKPVTQRALEIRFSSKEAYEACGYAPPLPLPLPFHPSL